MGGGGKGKGEGGEGRGGKERDTLNNQFHFVSQTATMANSCFPASSH